MTRSYDVRPFRTRGAVPSFALLLFFVDPTAALAQSPVPVIFDTDMGNDVDDLMALAMLHQYADHGLCRIEAVTVSKGHPLAAPFVDAANTFYGRPDIPIGAVDGGPTPEDGKYLRPLLDSGRYPYDLEPGRARDAVRVQRAALARAEDRSVIIIVVGFSTNLSRLLASDADALSPRGGRELVRRKVRLLSMMAGDYTLDGEP